MDTKLVILVLVGLIQQISGTSVICYHGTWSHYRLGNGKFSVSDVPAKLCTHYIYTFVGLDSDTNEVKSLDSWLDINLNGLNDANALKTVNPNLKTLLAVGGWNDGSAKYSVMAANATSRATFIASALKWVQKYNFDGFDIDWEYPARRDSSNPADKENFSKLIKEFYKTFHPLGLLVTAAVSAAPSYIDISYDVPALSKYLDFINVMLYDFHGAWENTASHNAPLYSAARFAGTVYADYSVNASIHGWISRGASPSKLALGVPFYGRNNILSNPDKTAPGSATTATGGVAGPYTATSGFLGYNEIIEKFNEGGWTTAWDDEQKVPYAFSGTTWLSYENKESLTLKVAYAKSLCLGAIMLWSIETEDFLGLSGTKYPLLEIIHNELNSNETADSSSSTKTASATTTTTSTTTTTPTTTTVSTTTTTTTTPTASSTSSSSSSTSSSTTSASEITKEDVCTAPGYFRSSANCRVFYYCQLSGIRYIVTKLICSAGLFYDTKLGICNYEKAVTC
ncbi:unnamed protein product [Ceutorhynchus assimilis]|uniref:chitinase n=1 Tax=Ceutorhynchus assimilis TaxID=467358 RepID=A0A9N9MRQ3_9CUCU|nr:unnamed protein product [Ceutorhynchus assimilis]